MKTYSSILSPLALLLFALFTYMQGASAQLLTVNELVSLRGKPLEEIKTALAQKGWAYKGDCGGKVDEQRVCFNKGDGRAGQAAVLYVVQSGADNFLEYSLFRTELIPTLQNNIRSSPFKLQRQLPLNKDVRLRVYAKDQQVLVVRGGVKEKYYSLLVLHKSAYDRRKGLTNY